VAKQISNIAKIKHALKLWKDSLGVVDDELNMNINIRVAQSDDWKSIQKLNNEVFQNDKDNDPDMDLNCPFTEKSIKYYKNLANGTYGHCFIAEINSEAVGYVALSIKYFVHRKSKYVEVENIGVSPEYRSQGIGEKLMNQAGSWAKEQGAQRLYVEAFWGNNQAIKYYKNNGFVEIGVELEKVL
jgi:ribosomal protein S18 acetylase RimI-like enzyme